MASQGSQTISLKVLIDKLLYYAHGNHSESVRLISKQPQPATIGSLTNLYKWVENLEEQFFQTEACKSMLLHPRNPYGKECRKLKLNIDDTEPTKYYICADWNCSRPDEYESDGLYSTFKNVRCNCGEMMDKEICMAKEDVGARAERDGGVFVCGTTKFMVTDDLQVEPISPATIVTLLHKLGLGDMSSLQETILSIGSEEILNLLKGSLFSKTPLTDVFLRKQGFTYEGIKFETEDAVQSKSSTCALMRSMNTQDVTLKLMTSTSMDKVLYAEAGEDMVDFLLSFLTFPLGSILQLLGGNSSMGSMDNLYRSVKHSKAMRDYELRDMLLNPGLSRGFGCRSNPLGVKESEQSAPSLWCRSYENGKNKDDPYTGYLSTEKSNLSISPSGDCSSILRFVCAGHQGFLKAPATFRVMDNLVLKPLVSRWSLSIVKQLKVPLNDLEVREINVRREQGLRLLKAFLFSKSLLTDVLPAMVNFDLMNSKQEK
ncbi:uncharacterized protein LOC122645356 [Telopea speciosissima]|uniref:uncharacterized protein LOC122645356 n=1 Tax=Telopea speciosissima TaxID=54955 RepID=UPI001CC52ACD|nr:uncharacterized protein LOC122645356 [Telopea speciosissima]